MHEPESSPEPEQDQSHAEPMTPPRVWPVFAVYLGVFGFLLLMGGALVLAGLIIATLRNGEAIEPDEIVPLAESLLDSPTLMLASAVSSSTTLLLAALLAVRFAREQVRERLRLVPGARLGAAAAAVVGFLGLAQMFDSTFALAGWEVGGAIGYISRAVARAEGPTLGLTILFMGLVAGIGEEFFFRGYMQTRLRSRYGPWKAILITSVAFGLLHLDPVHTPYAFVAGLYLGWVTEQTGSILPAVAAHVINNTLWVALVALEMPAIPAAWHTWLLAACVAVGLGSVLVLARPRGEPVR